ncbi:MAG: SDR family oxidoreductase [Gammaproteobacteria bacterium]|nr:SDR family oxidoreductase [Gammaproteobacteria bacterium]MBP7912173.1 SDR family oxidoreductase [Pseudomonadales bacterium]HQY69214.1 SDR family oxidoreductase [Pseudomonadales bacterium]
MNGADILIAGCGDVGGALAERLRDAGHRVAGLRRRAGLLPAGIEPLAADLGEPATLALLGERRFDIVVVSSAAGRFDEDHYRRVYVEGLANLLDVLRGTPHVLLASSTAVYHQCDGEWVDEDSPTEPHGFSGRILLQAEALLRERAAHRATVLRFGGIYGPGRERLLREVAAGIGCAREPVRYTNRIHREDCAGILQFLVGRLLRGETLAPLYLGVDSEPAPMWEVRHWIAAELGVALDDAAGGAQGGRAPGSKRCSNRRLLEAGYALRYPDFRAGYAPLIAPLRT